MRGEGGGVLGLWGFWWEGRIGKQPSIHYASYYLICIFSTKPDFYFCYINNDDHDFSRCHKSRQLNSPHQFSNKYEQCSLDPAYCTQSYSECKADLWHNLHTRFGSAASFIMLQSHQLFKLSYIKKEAYIHPDCQLVQVAI